MASTEGLVPITREFLSRFYDKYPFQELAGELGVADSKLREQNEVMNKAFAEKSGNDRVSELAFESPHKIDENFWRKREQIEEILFLFDQVRRPSGLESDVTETIEKLVFNLRTALKAIEGYQASSSEKVFSMILTYMPQDFRSTLIKQQRDRSEKKRQAEVDVLLSSGGSIHDKYALLWRQQMDRRKQLAMLGAATGVYKTLLRFLVGVPPVLLDFVQQINDHNGPMEEQRQRYGPPLYQLTQFGLHIRIFVDLWWKTFDNPSLPQKECMSLLEDSLHLYVSELERFLRFIREVFENSPFLISAEEAGSGNLATEFKETVLAAGKTHEVVLSVDSEGSYVAWDFKLTTGKDIGFSVEYVSAEGIRTAMLPFQRYSSHQGNFYSPGVGCYKLLWDNSYSTFNKKTLRYRVDAIPPVADGQKDCDS